MNRITIASVLAILTALSSAGCLGPSSTSEGSDEQDVTTQVPAAPAAKKGNPVSAAKDQPVQTLEFHFKPPTDSEGPLPEPWFRVMGPLPEPWTGKAQETTPNGNDTSDSPTKP